MLELLSDLADKPVISRHHFHWGFRSFLSIFLVSLLCSAVVLACTAFEGWGVPVGEGKREKRLRSVLALFGSLVVMGLFGGLVGFHGGNSRVGVVGDLMPAVVALIAGLAAYLFGVADKRPGPNLFPMLAVFVSVLFITYGMGSGNRSGNQSKASQVAFCREAFAQPEILADAEALVRAAEIHIKTCPNEAGHILPN